MRPLYIGLTGGIGSGKSTVSGLLVAQGAALVDTDAIARALTAPGGAAMPAIGEAFGAQMVNPGFDPFVLSGLGGRRRGRLVGWSGGGVASGRH
jgi:hypothetical protein